MMSEHGPSTANPAEPPILISTMQIDPAEYSLKTAGNRVIAAMYALAGLLYLLRRQRSIRWLTGATFICVMLAVWLEIAPALLIELVLAIGLVWITEALNTAIEAAVDVASPEFHPMAKVSKDVAAAATLIASCLAGLVGLMILLPPLLERLF